MKTDKGRGTGRGSGPAGRSLGLSRNAYPMEFRVRAVEEVLRGGARHGDVARAYGIGTTTLSAWIAAFRESGIEGLRPLGHTRSVTARAPRSDTRRDAVTQLKRQHPDYGTRRIRDVLRRFEALGVSETVVRRILHEEGLLEERAAATPAREHPPRRFERAEPNQLWQSDIFTFLLRRYHRVYLAAFMDDHSRYLV